MQADKRVYELESNLHQAMANPKRVEIIYTLAQREMTAGELAQVVDVTMPNLSQHLSLMKQYGLVEARKDGLNMYYRLTSDLVLKACQAVRQILTRYLTQQRAILRQFAPAQQPEVKHVEAPVSEPPASVNKSALIRSLLDQGKQVKEIARDLGINYTFVYGVAKRYREWNGKGHPAN